MNKQKTERVLNKIISSCHEITLAEDALRKIGIDITENSITSARERLIECVCIMFDVDSEDMRGDEIVQLCCDEELDETQILERLITIFGEGALE